eukprot:TRINITY_DN108899_c0_g1_i1.p1 TRINITY_DN108899_c0_g1~~TRINITY_DN108899_c0_g1_i1.p1  ORF type:complete len:107 (+),score=23.09 TRINITY_DN108899_c0_g1_i1:106-426(+)
MAVTKMSKVVAEAKKLIATKTTEDEAIRAVKELSMKHYGVKHMAALIWHHAYLTKAAMKVVKLAMKAEKPTKKTAMKGSAAMKAKKTAMKGSVAMKAKRTAMKRSS